MQAITSPTTRTPAAKTASSSARCAPTSVASIGGATARSLGSSVRFPFRAHRVEASKKVEAMNAAGNDGSLSPWVTTTNGTRVKYSSQKMSTAEPGLPSASSSDPKLSPGRTKASKWSQTSSTAPPQAFTPAYNAATPSSDMASNVVPRHSSAAPSSHAPPPIPAPAMPITSSSGSALPAFESSLPTTAGVPPPPAPGGGQPGRPMNIPGLPGSMAPQGMPPAGSYPPPQGMPPSIPSPGSAAAGYYMPDPPSMPSIPSMPELETNPMVAAAIDGDEDVDPILKRLVDVEAAAVLGKSYNVAARAQEGITRFLEINQELAVCRASEIESGLARDYASALQSKNKVDALEQELVILAGHDFWSGELPDFYGLSSLGGSGAAGGMVSGPTVPVRFRLPCQVDFGMSCFVIGSGEALGDWNEEMAVPMTWTPEGWVCEMMAPPGSIIDYKFIQRKRREDDQGWEVGAMWQENPNRRLVVPSNNCMIIDVAGSWERSPDDEVAWFCSTIEVTK